MKEFCERFYALNLPNKQKKIAQLTNQTESFCLPKQHILCTSALLETRFSPYRKSSIMKKKVFLQISLDNVKRFSEHQRSEEDEKIFLFIQSAQHKKSDS